MQHGVAGFDVAAAAAAVAGLQTGHSGEPHLGR